MVSLFESLPPMVGVRPRFVHYCLSLSNMGNAGSPPGLSDLVPIVDPSTRLSAHPHEIR